MPSARVVAHSAGVAIGLLGSVAAAQPATGEESSPAATSRSTNDATSAPLIPEADASADASAVSPQTEPPGDEHWLTWDYPHFRTIEYGITINFIWQLALLEFFVKNPKEANWEGGILFDDDVREAMALESRQGRELVGDVSDPGAIILQLHPVVVDSVLVPLLLDDFNLEVAWQMTWLNFQAMSAVGFFNRIGHRFVARARPTVEDCARDPDHDKYCTGNRFTSFPSGHTSGAFLGAGMSCAHHLHMPLYGGGAFDVVFGCAVPVAASTSIGVARLLADRHYMTDIIAGAVVGFGGGFGLPYLTHYAFGEGDEGDAEAKWVLEPADGGAWTGLRGTF